MTYTPYAPTALANGTAVVEAQCDFATAAIQKVLDSAAPGNKKIKAIEALTEAEDEWARYIESQNEGTLFPLTESWWTGTNVPGRKSQLLTYLLGLQDYESDIRTRLDRLEGFEVRYWDGSKVQSRPKATTAATDDLKKRKMEAVPLADHVEHKDEGVNGASEAAEILRPAVAAT